MTGTAGTTVTVTLPGRPDSVVGTRAFTHRVLAGHPAMETAVLCVSELAANAIEHSPSGKPGGTFTVTITATPVLLRIEVTDAGTTPVVPAQWPPLDAERGRGLHIVAALAYAYGFTLGRVWCELPVTATTATAIPATR